MLKTLSLEQVLLKATDKIYNYEFIEAEKYIHHVNSKYPQHPAVPFLKAMQTYWQYMPLKKNPYASTQYVNYMNQVILLSKKMLDRNENDSEGIFFSLAAHSYLAMKYYYDRKTTEAIGEAKNAYSYLNKGTKILEIKPEFYFSTGMYNYCIEKYKMEYPLSKPLLYFFESGDMVLGIRQMEVAIRQGNFTRTETALYLGQIYLNRENQPAQAVSCFKPLADKYPQNPLFTLRCAQALVQAGRYDDALPYANRLHNFPQKFLDKPLNALDRRLKGK
ncbi:hypothetical protein GCM10027275_13510 [Rhabdobacter roseus]